jgi:hypothetical protein
MVNSISLSFQIKNQSLLFNDTLWRVAVLFLNHVLVGPSHGHGEHWQNKARELGVTWERRYHK